MDDKTVLKLFERLDSLGGEIHDIHLLVNSAMGKLDWHTEKLLSLEQNSHAPAMCQLATKLEGIGRDGKSALRTISWVVGLITAAITGTMALMISKVLAR